MGGGRAGGRWAAVLVQTLSAHGSSSDFVAEQGLSVVKNLAANNDGNRSSLGSAGACEGAWARSSWLVGGSLPSLSPPSCSLFLSLPPFLPPSLPP